ncbi:MAG: dTDP-4-dehydrorhamnose reductase [Calditrichia bacterium]
MKRILITGANGLLGQALVRQFFGKFALLSTGVEERPFWGETGIDYQKLDITDAKACKEIVKEFQPHFIINAAAFTAVDACETEKELCWSINVKGVENLIHAARYTESHIIHYSTDYLFDGKNGPYAEDAPLNPLGYYGKSKLASENALHASGMPHTIFRTNVLFGYAPGVKNNFVLWVLRNLKEGKTIRVVTDQYNNPTLAEDLARLTMSAVNNPVEGVFNGAGADYCNRFEFAKLIAETFGLDMGLIKPITTEELGQSAPRPMKGGLIIDKARKVFDFHPVSLPDALKFLNQKMRRYEERESKSPAHHSNL